MKAAVCREFGKPLVIEEVTLADAGPGEVKVKLSAVAICHSDISYADGAWAARCLLYTVTNVPELLKLLVAESPQ